MSDKKAYYEENKEKIIQRQKKWNDEHRKQKGKLANKRDRIRLQLKKTEKRVEAFKKHLAEINT